ncbi:polysaccharide deacetylase family protein [Bacillus sp. FJAT-18017]|uniref:polysaccharide deacetylase family protein n=1 Tax=Bacillus sp. FJAT-18017 TaxID=1705566 RepID=UPI0006ADEB96|nr:polysaccharide deacetylase family protein [Bacillus sp. FJAT-18017]
MKKGIFLFLISFLFFMVPGHTSAQQKVPILIYHSIDEYKGHGSKELYVTPENFEKQMIYLKKNGFTLLTFERWQDIGKVNKPIFLTFDDGYKNNLTVYSIFQKLRDNKFKPAATFFIPADFIGRSNRLSAAELKMLSDSGMISIQSHTVTHPDLTKMSNIDYELKASRDKLQNITRKPVIALAYPYGNFNNKVVQETKKYYKYGLTTTPGPFLHKGVKDELFLLPRTYVKYSTTLEEFAKLVETDR